MTSRQVAIAQDLKPRDLDYGQIRLRETGVSVKYRASQHKQSM